MCEREVADVAVNDSPFILIQIRNKLDSSQKPSVECITTLLRVWSITSVCLCVIFIIDCIRFTIIWYSELLLRCLHVIAPFFSSSISVFFLIFSLIDSQFHIKKKQIDYHWFNTKFWHIHLFQIYINMKYNYISHLFIVLSLSVWLFSFSLYISSSQIICIWWDHTLFIVYYTWFFFVLCVCIKWQNDRMKESTKEKEKKESFSSTFEKYAIFRNIVDVFNEIFFFCVRLRIISLMIYDICSVHCTIVQNT